MLAVIRHYEHVAPAAARSVIDARHQIDALLQAVPGARATLLIRTHDGLALVALGADEWCLAECGRRFRAWADGHVTGFRATEEAAIWVGEVIGSSGALFMPSRPADGADPSQQGCGDGIGPAMPGDHRKGEIT